jgi:anti-sigma-K factor RskA
MSDIQDHSALPEDELLAAEYALGVLAGADRAAAEARAARDRAFARMIADWEVRLAPWAAAIAEVAPPPQVWDRIAAELPTMRPPRAGLWQSILFWRGFALASAVAAVCLAAFVFVGILSRQPPLVATIEGGGHRSFVATVDTKRATIAVVPAAFAADPTRVPELWLIPPGGKPLPVGLLRADRAVVITIPAALIAQTESGATLAVSLEPPGGSPTGAPTGPVIGAGKLTNL